MKKDKEKQINKKYIDHIKNIQIDVNINDKLDFLKLNTVELCEKYQKVATDEYLTNDYLNLIRLFYDKDLINITILQKYNY